MLQLTLAVLVFLATHIVLSSTPLRGRIVGRIGEKAFLGLYSLIALLAIVWMSIAYAQAPQYQHLWLPGPGLRHLPLLLMPLVFILLAAGLTAKNPTAVQGEDALDRQDAVQGILRITRHPVQWAIVLWAALHILANGDLASLVFFGGFLLLAAAGPLLIDRKLAAAQGARWERFAATTSNLPFAAVLQGRQRLALAEIGWRPVIIGLAVYALMLALHPWLFGASPM